MSFRDWRAFTGALIVGLLIILVPAVNAWAKAIGTPTIGIQCVQKTPYAMHADAHTQICGRNAAAAHAAVQTEAAGVHVAVPSERKVPNEM